MDNEELVDLVSNLWQYNEALRGTLTIIALTLAESEPGIRDRLIAQLETLTNRASHPRLRPTPAMTDTAERLLDALKQGLDAPIPGLGTGHVADILHLVPNQSDPDTSRD